MPNSFPEITVASRIGAERLLRPRRTGPRVTSVISIGDPEDGPPQGYERVPVRLRLEFHDVVHDGEFALAPSADDVAMIIRFAERVAPSGGHLLIHCGAGVSRSTAAALTVLAVWLGPGREVEAVETLHDVAPQAWPNERMVELADELLGREGALVRALENGLY
jgi:predicted protein tyrosine phosphatase